MGKLKPTLATAVQQRCGGRFDSHGEPCGIRTLPIRTEERTVVMTNGDDNPPVVSPTWQVNVHYFTAV
jgi:hypothetical protein